MHTCPNCGQPCSCCGDIDDIVTGEWKKCLHYQLEPDDCFGEDDFYEADFYEDYFEDEDFDD